MRAILQEGVDEAGLLVPQQAVTRAPDGSASVLVVGTDNKVAKRPLTVGRAVGNRWQVLTGLSAGERVLVDGVQRVRVGDTVKVIELAATEDSGVTLALASTATSAQPAAGAQPGEAPASAPVPALTAR